MIPRDTLPVDCKQKDEIVQQRVRNFVLYGILGLSTFLLFLVSLNLGFIMAKVVTVLPDIRLLENWQPNQSTQIFDSHGQLIANIHGDEDRVVVPMSDISPNISRAVMAIEDNRFYQHNGIDIRGTMRALVQNAQGGDVQGGSTVTQQLVKNLFLTPERSVGRKIAEALLALRVENHYNKNTIMTMYLNQVYWGNQAYGIEKAARRYFKEPAKDLTIAQSALLAGLLKAPEGLSPYAYPKAARLRQLEVLGKMYEYGYISKEQYHQAVKEKITLNSQKVHNAKYPYFVTYVIQELVKQFGEDAVRRGGLKVYTSLDPDVQDAAEKALVDKVTGLPKGAGVNQGALVAIDVETAEIIAMVGGVDFEKSQFNNATQARRAAGSSFKPFVYLTGFRLGLITPDTPISDKPVYFNTGYSVWSPKNWDGRYMGAMNIRRALVLSRNTTTVQVGMKVGIDEVIRTARLAGVTSPIDRNFSSLLGSSGFSPLEIATGYSTFARGGIRMAPTAIHHLENIRGQTIPLEYTRPERVFDDYSVAELVSILIDVVEKGTGRNAILPGRKVAGKTGTTDKVRDIWFTGFTPDMVACVWMGNLQYQPLHGVFSSDSAQVWHNFADAYYKVKNIPPNSFTFMQTAKPKEINKKKTSADFEHAPNVPLPKPGQPELDTTEPASEPPADGGEAPQAQENASPLPDAPPSGH